MTSRNQELNKVFEELKNISLKRQQLLERKKVQCVFQELRDRTEFQQAGEAAVTDFLFFICIFFNVVAARVILESTMMEAQWWANSLCF